MRELLRLMGVVSGTAALRERVESRTGEMQKITANGRGKSFQ